MNTNLESDRLFLENYHMGNLENVRELLSEPLVWKFSSRKATNNIEDARKYLNDIMKNYEEGKYDFQALYLKETNEYIGEAGALSFNKGCNRAVVGYNLLPRYWSNGYATEITKALVRYLFEDIGVERVEALVGEENDASKKVLEKSGFVCEGLLRNFGYINDRYMNVCYYGMIKSDYFNKK